MCVLLCNTQIDGHRKSNYQNFDEITTGFYMFFYLRRTAEQKGSNTHHDRVRFEIRNSTVDSTSRSEREFEVPVPATARVQQKSVKVPLGYLFFIKKFNDF